MALAVVLPLVAALAFALSHLCVKLGLEESNPATAVAVNVTVNALGLWMIAFLTSPIREIWTWGLWPFVVAGCFAPSLARMLLFHGYRHMGMARADVVAGSVPLFSVSLAVLLLGERPSTMMILGTAGVVLGVILLNYRPDYSKPWAWWAVLLPLGAAVCFAFREVFGKMGLERVPVPVTGAAFMASVAALVLYLSFLFSGNQAKFRGTRRSLLLFFMAGVCVTAAYVSIFIALRSNMVSLISPLLSIHPLFSLLLTYLFLQASERVTGKAVLGGVLVVAGAVAVVVGRV